jgi:CheY-like chemotaxis protein
MKIWLIEDDGFKRDKLKAALQEMFDAVEIHMARSAKSAFKLLSVGIPDLIVLDMSLPTFDIGPYESGGRPQGFGGVEVLREMERREIVVPVVVVTQYAVFGEERVGIKELAKRLERDHSSTFSSLVYYDSASEQWKEDLKAAVTRALVLQNRRPPP